MKRATQDFHRDEQFTSLTLIGGRDCNDIVNINQNPDLWVHGGALLERNLCVGGNIVAAGLTANTCSDLLLVRTIQEKVAGEGINIVSDVTTIEGNLIVNGTIMGNTDTDNLYLPGYLTVDGKIQGNSDLCIAGDAMFEGDVVVQGNIMSGFINIQGNCILSGDGAAMVCVYDGGATEINTTGLTIDGPVEITENVNVAGKLTADDICSNTITVFGSADLCGDTIVKGNLTLQDGGAITANTLNVMDDAEFCGDVLIKGNVDVSGTTGLNEVTANILTVNNDTDLCGDVTIKGNLFVSNIFPPTGDLIIAGNIFATNYGQSLIMDELAVGEKYPTTTLSAGLWYGTGTKAQSQLNSCTIIGNGATGGTVANQTIIGANASGQASAGFASNTAIGYNAFAYNAAVAIGVNASASGFSGFGTGVAIGANTSGGAAGVVIGPGANLAGTQPSNWAYGIAIGASAQNYHRGVAIGQSASSRYQGVAIGTSAFSRGDSNTGFVGEGVAIGQGAVATRQAVCVGTSTNSAIDAFRSVCLGYDAHCTGVAAIALGDGARGSATQACAIGDAAIVTATGGIAIGRGINANQVNGFFVSHRSIETSSVGLAGFVPGTNELIEPTLTTIVIPNNTNASLKGVPVGGLYRSANNSAVSVSTFAITADYSVTGNALTVTATSGSLTPGMFLTGGNVASGVEIIAQVSGAAGDTGVYYTDIIQPMGRAATAVEFNSATDGDQIFIRTA